MVFNVALLAFNLFKLVDFFITIKFIQNQFFY